MPQIFKTPTFSFLKSHKLVTWLALTLKRLTKCVSEFCQNQMDDMQMKNQYCVCLVMKLCHLYKKKLYFMTKHCDSWLELLDTVDARY